MLPVRGTKAFTLLELIVVIVVLAILAALAIPTFQQVIDKAHDHSAATSLMAIGRDAAALEGFESGEAFGVAQIVTAIEETHKAAGTGVHAASSWKSADNLPGNSSPSINDLQPGDDETAVGIPANPSKNNSQQGYVGVALEIGGTKLGLVTRSRSGRCVYSLTEISGGSKWWTSKTKWEACPGGNALRPEDPITVEPEETVNSTSITLTLTPENGTVNLNWTTALPEGTVYTVQRDGTPLGTTTQKTYADPSPGDQERTYTVRSTVQNGEETQNVDSNTVTYTPGTTEETVTPPSSTLGVVNGHLAVSSIAGSAGNAGSVSGTGTSARLNMDLSRAPGRMVSAGSHIYFSEVGAIRRLDPATGTVSDFSGDKSNNTSITDGAASTAKYGIIKQMTADENYIYTLETADTATPRSAIRRVSLATGAAETISDLGTIYSYGGIALGAEDYLYYTRSGTYPNIQRVKTDGLGQELWLDAGSTTSFGVGQLAYDNGALLVHGLQLYRIPVANKTVNREIINPYSLPAITENVYYMINKVGVVAWDRSAPTSSNMAVAYRGYTSSTTPTTGTPVHYAAGPAVGDAPGDGTGPDVFFSRNHFYGGIIKHGDALYFADPASQVIRSAEAATWTRPAAPQVGTVTLGITQSNVQVSTLAVSGATTSVNRGIVFNGSDAYVAQRYGIYKVDTTTGAGTLLAGSASGGYVDSPVAARSRFLEIQEIETDGYYLYVKDADAGNGGRRNLRRVNLTTGATTTMIAGQAGAGREPSHSLAANNSIVSLAVSPTGTLYAQMYDTGGSQGAIVQFSRPDTITTTNVQGQNNYTSAADGLHLWNLSAGSNNVIVRNLDLSAAGTHYLGASYLSYAGGGMFTKSTGTQLIIPSVNGANGYPYGLATFDKVTHTVTPLVGTQGSGYADGDAAAARFNRVQGVASDGENLWVVDQNPSTLQMVLRKVSKE